MIVHGYLHVMIDLILVNEDTGVFGNEISIQGDISCCTKREEMRELHQKSSHNLKVTYIKHFVLPVRYGERDVGSMTKHFIYERLRERHLGLI